MLKNVPIWAIFAALSLALGQLGYGNLLASWAQSDERVEFISIVPATPSLRTIGDVRATETSLFSPVLLSTTLQNKAEQTEQVISIVEIRDSQGVTQDLKLGRHLLKPGETLTIDPIYIPESAGDYTQRVFTISDEDTPIVLSNVQSTNFHVGDTPACIPSKVYILKTQDDSGASLFVIKIPSGTVAGSDMKSNQHVFLLAGVKETTRLEKGKAYSEPLLVAGLFSGNRSAENAANATEAMQSFFRKEVKIVIPLVTSGIVGKDNPTTTIAPSIVNVADENVIRALTEIVRSLVRVECGGERTLIASAPKLLVNNAERSFSNSFSAKDITIFAQGTGLLAASGQNGGNPCDRPPGCYPPPGPGHLVWCNEGEQALEGTCDPYNGGSNGSGGSGGGGRPGNDRPDFDWGDDTVWDRIWAGEQPENPHENDGNHEGGGADCAEGEMQVHDMCIPTVIAP